jgi:hypothetical protein
LQPDKPDTVTGFRVARLTDTHTEGVTMPRFKRPKLHTPDRILDGVKGRDPVVKLDPDDIAIVRLLQPPQSILGWKREEDRKAARAALNRFIASLLTDEPVEEYVVRLVQRLMNRGMLTVTENLRWPQGSDPIYRAMESIMEECPGGELTIKTNILFRRVKKGMPELAERTFYRAIERLRELGILTPN